MLDFVPAVGEFVIPELWAGSENLMIGSIWQAFFIRTTGLGFCRRRRYGCPAGCTDCPVPAHENRELEEGRPRNAENQIILVLETDAPASLAFPIFRWWFWSSILSMNPNWLPFGGFQPNGTAH